MAYLKDFCDRIHNNDLPGFIKLWEEYCYGDQPDGEEMVAVLEEVRKSDLSRHFGIYVERLLPLWGLLLDKELAHAVLRLILDLQTTQSEELSNLAIEYLKNRFPNDPLFSEKLRLVGLRNREKFQGAIRNFELLSHFKKGNYVFHTAGWGTGEILDVSLVREEVTIEFEYVLGPQHFSFEKAFKTLIPLPPDHFYSRRFGNPDLLEKEAKESPGDLIRLLLRDLGPKNASEIKEELCDLVIPATEWNRWWQTARGKIKKDTMIESPKELKDPFYLRKKEIPHEVAFHQALEGKPEVQALIPMIYTFLRDFPEILKKADFKASLETRVKQILQEETITESQKLQLLFICEDLSLPKASEEIAHLIGEMKAVTDAMRSVEVLAYQKRALQVVKKVRNDWKDAFLELLFSVDQNVLRDFILGELDTPSTRQDLKHKLNELLIHPLSYPDVFVWYFQKIIQASSKLPFAEPEGKNDFFEGLLILLDHLEKRPQHRDMAKKILGLITANRYKIVREIMAHSSQEEVKEYLLLATKCGSMTDHDIKILHSLAEVAHPTLSMARKKKDQAASSDEHIIWTTKEGYLRTQQRIQHIATVETVQNAKEIETARAHGDLRENAEFKAALEKRDRLQTELKSLSDQLARARILSPEDVSVDEVGVGSVILCQDEKGEHHRYILLGPWDADPEKRILSFQSKLAQAMKGKSIGDTFKFQGEDFTITELQNYFDLKL